MIDSVAISELDGRIFVCKEQIVISFQSGRDSKHVQRRVHTGSRGIRKYMMLRQVKELFELNFVFYYRF